LRGQQIAPVVGEEGDLFRLTLLGLQRLAQVMGIGKEQVDRRTFKALLLEFGRELLFPRSKPVGFGQSRTGSGQQDGQQQSNDPPQQNCPPGRFQGRVP